jgi:hypothetical protein
LEVDALDNPAAIDIKAGNDPDCEAHGCAGPHWYGS